MKCFKMEIDDLRLRHPINKYVDDSTLTEIIQKVSYESTIQQSVDDTVKWTKQNDMKINAPKTHEMVVNFQNDKLIFAPITIEGSQIERVTAAKLVEVQYMTI